MCGGEEIHAAAGRFRDRCLLNDGALFSGDGVGGASGTLWTVQRLSGLDNLDTPVQGGGSFIDGLRSQLDGRTDEEIQLVAEAVGVLLLFGHDTAGETRIAHVRALLAEMREPAELPVEMERAFHAGGVAKFSAGNAWRHAYVRFLIRFATRVKELTVDERTATLSDPWRFRDLVAEVRTSTDAMAANSLLHAVFPETFESMVLESHRAAFVEAFAGARGVADAPSTDAQIARVRELAQAGRPAPLDLYEPPLYDVWKHEPSSAWAQAVALGAKLCAHPEVRFAGARLQAQGRGGSGTGPKGASER